AGGNGGDHFADLGVFGNDNAGEGSANGAVVNRLLGFLNASLRAGHLLFGQGDFCFQAVGGGVSVIELLLSLHAGGLQLLGAAELDARVSELHLEIGNGRLGGIVIGFSGVEGLADVGIVERSQQLIFGDVGTFV